MRRKLPSLTAPPPRSLRKWRAVLGSVAISYGDAASPPAAACDLAEAQAQTRLARIRGFGRAPARPLLLLGRAVRARTRTFVHHLLGS